MNPLHVIGDSDTVLAFALGGVPGRVAHTEHEARTAVDAVVQAVSRGGGVLRAPALILITHRMAALIRPYLHALILDAEAPLVLEIPGFGELHDEGPGDRFVERVLGIRHDTP